MRRKTLVAGLALVACLALEARPALADQWFGLNIGYFATRGESGRVGGDVIAANRTFLTFNPSDLRNATVGGEWLVDLGRHLEAGLGMGYYSSTAPSVYTNYVNTDGSEIRQQLRLRIVPVTATVRYLPFGNDAPIQPVRGRRVGIYNWRYSETGDFVDFTNYSIFHGAFAASGTDVGPVVLGGARVPFGPMAIGGEIRYQAGSGSLPASGGFAGTKIDLGGYNYLATFQVKF